jgi:hypothetical protein
VLPLQRSKMMPSKSRESVPLLQRNWCREPQVSSSSKVLMLRAENQLYFFEVMPRVWMGTVAEGQESALLLQKFSFFRTADAKSVSTTSSTWCRESAGSFCLSCSTPKPYGTKLRKKLRSMLRLCFDQAKLRSKLGFNFFLNFDEKSWHKFNSVLTTILFPEGR